MKAASADVSPMMKMMSIVCLSTVTCSENTTSGEAPYCSRGIDRELFNDRLRASQR